MNMGELESALGSQLGESALGSQVRDSIDNTLPYRIVKRAFDVVFSLAVLVIGFIPMLILCLLVAIDTKGSPIYTQMRIGQNGRPFKLFKFRTMVVDADDIEKHLSDKQREEWHSERKVSDDPRITPLGSVLRKTSVDEIPQFLNVLLGDMSVIGPRPITAEELVWFGKDRDLYLSVPMGITGWWQVRSRNQADFESGDRQTLELYYVRNASFALDARIFMATFGVMFGKGGTGK